MHDLKLDSDTRLGSDRLRDLKLDSDSRIGSDRLRDLKLDSDTRIGSDRLRELDSVTRIGSYKLHLRLVSVAKSRIWYVVCTVLYGLTNDE